MLYTAFFALLLAAANGPANADSAPANTQVEKVSLNVQDLNTLMNAINAASGCFSVALNITLGLQPDEHLPQCEPDYEIVHSNFEKMRHLQNDPDLAAVLANYTQSNATTASRPASSSPKDFIDRMTSVMVQKLVVDRATERRGVIIKYRGAVKELDHLIDRATTCYTDFSFEGGSVAAIAYKDHFRWCREAYNDAERLRKGLVHPGLVVSWDLLERAKLPNTYDRSEATDAATAALRERMGHLRDVRKRAESNLGGVLRYDNLLIQFNVSLAEAQYCFGRFSHNATTALDSDKIAKGYMEECEGYLGDAKKYAAEAAGLLTPEFVAELKREGLPLMTNGGGDLPEQAVNGTVWVSLYEVESEAEVSRIIVNEYVPNYYNLVDKVFREVVGNLTLRVVMYEFLNGNTDVDGVIKRVERGLLDKVPDEIAVIHNDLDPISEDEKPALDIPVVWVKHEHNL